MVWLISTGTNLWNTDRYFSAIDIMREIISKNNGVYIYYFNTTLIR